MDKQVLDSLTAMLWPVGDGQAAQQVYWLLDGARDPQIASLVKSGDLDYECLFAGELHPRLQAAAPYLVHLKPESPGTALLLNLGWGQAWGVLALAPSEVPLGQLRLHFKKFLRVRTEDGKELAFRFYDPRVLTVYLPTCTAAEFTVFLGPASRLYAEFDTGQGVRVFRPDATGIWARDYRLGDAVCRTIDSKEVS